MKDEWKGQFEIESGFFFFFRKMNKEKIDVDESKFEREVWKVKNLGIMVLGVGEEIRFL